MTTSQFLTIKRAIVPALLSAQRHAATATSKPLRRHYRRGEEQLTQALRTLDALAGECFPNKPEEPELKLRIEQALPALEEDSWGVILK